MQYPIWEFELTYEFLRADVTQEYQTLLGFFLSRLGAFDTFLFKDLDDYLVTAGRSATADGVTTQFGFLRTIGGFAELVGQVDKGHTINVYVNGTLPVGPTYTIALPNQIVFTPRRRRAWRSPPIFSSSSIANSRRTRPISTSSRRASGRLQKIVLETVPQ
jgi:hypothetical protein